MEKGRFLVGGRSESMNGGSLPIVVKHFSWSRAESRISNMLVVAERSSWRQQEASRVSRLDVFAGRLFRHADICH